LSRKQEQAIACLIQHPTIAATASAAGIDEKTLRKWMRLLAFEESDIVFGRV
jgi:hypothetical protein